MRTNKNRSGLALGSIVALVAGLFTAAPAAVAATETAPVITPTVGTGTAIINSDGFELVTRLGASQGGSGTWSYHIVQSTTSQGSLKVGLGSTTSSYTDTNINSTSATVGWINTAAGQKFLKLSLAGATSISSQVDVTVTPYQDMDGNNVKGNGDIVGDAITVSFHPWSALGVSVAITSPVANDVGVTASFTVTSGTINYDQLDSSFALTMMVTGTEASSTAATVTGSTLVLGSYSASGSVGTDALTTSGAVDSVSAWVLYNSASLSAVTTVGVAARTITGVTLSAVAGDNVKQTGANAADARINSAFTVNAYPHSTAQTVSMAVAGAFTVSSVGTNIEFGRDSGVTINGTSYTSSAALLAAGFTQAAGTTTVAISTFGQDSDGSNETIAVRFSSQLASSTLTITLKTPTYSVIYTPTAIAGPAGSSKTFAVAVKDNWLKSSARTDQRVAASVVLGGSTSETVSSAVVAGAASVAVAPTPATRTGSATVTLTLQTFNQDTQMWDDTATDTATWNVYSGADSFTSRTASVSSSISYGVALSYSPDVTVVVANSNSDVVVSAPGLIIRDVNDTTATASDTLTIAATNQTLAVDFAATKTGTYVVTFTNGSASTTSEVVVEAAPSDKGYSIVWDTTVIEPGRTRVVTGTLLDANGNPVDTTAQGETTGDSAGTASIAVSYTGTAGIIVGSLPTETDADGKFKLSVLTSANDSGTLTLTAVYMPQGASTVAANKVTSVQAINVGVVASADTKVNAGSFKGYVAVYAKGYAGSRLSAKVGNDWVVVESLASNFERVVEFTGAGYTIAVRIYIDRVLVDTITVTTK